MLPNKKMLFYFLLIMLLWITGSQEMYVNKVILRTAVGLRYTIYFIWLFLTAAIGYAAFRKGAAKQAWITVYALVFMILLLLGVVDLFILHFSKAQKTYIQTFRLFFQSPVAFVIMHLMLKQQPAKNINLPHTGMMLTNS